MTASTVMNVNPTVLRDSDTVATAAHYVMERRYRSVPVVDEKGRYLGAVTVNCLLRKVLPRAAVMEHGLTAIPFVSDSLEDLRRRFKEVENDSVLSCLNDAAAVVHPDTPLLESLLTLYRTRTAVPVVEKDSGRLVGVISYWDVGTKILEGGA